MPIGKYIYCTSYYFVHVVGVKVTNAYRQVHLLYLHSGLLNQSGSAGHKCLSASTFTVRLPEGRPLAEGEVVTNAYRQVHLLYTSLHSLAPTSQASQMPIGKYIYCTGLTSQERSLWSQMPIGKYIYCTPEGMEAGKALVREVTNAYRQVHLLYSKRIFTPPL